MKSIATILTVLTILIFSTSSAGSDRKSVAAAIAKVNQELESALTAGDATRSAAIYTTDAQLLPPNSSFVTGEANIVGFWQGAFDNGLGGAELETVELDVSGQDTAIEVGTYILKNKDGGDIDRGKYLVVWKKEDGEWKYHWDMWNSSNAPAPTN